MKYSGIFHERINCVSSKEVFDYIFSTLMNSITGYSYFVNWGKVCENTEKLLEDLKKLDELSGSPDIQNDLDALLKDNHSVAAVFPALIASRVKSFEILSSYSKGNLQTEQIDFRKLDMDLEDDRAKVVKFAEKTGILGQIKSGKLDSLYSYMMGVEVGLDTNARKNRTGTLMEEIVEYHVKEICENHGYQYIAQANAKAIYKKFNIEVKVDKSNRIVDFAVLANGKLYIIETNFYGGGGSKLKATAGEYIEMQNRWSSQGFGFIWITDGAGWRTTRKPIEEAFNVVDYVLNLDMVAKGLLEDILSQSL